MVHTCPRCDLRFVSNAELADHLDTDHHADPKGFERFHYRPPASRPAGTRFLVVANQTLLDEALITKIRSLAATGAHFHIVVPATPIRGSGPAHHDADLALATYRARHLVDTLLAAGIAAEAEVGDPEPIKAIARALEHEPADEVLVSTLAPGLSRWLKVGLPDQITRAFHLPVQVVTVEA